MNTELAQLAEDYWEYRLELQPTTAFMLGFHRNDAANEDWTREGEDAKIARLEQFAADAAAIDPEGLTADEQVVLRGRTEPTRLAVLAGAPAATTAS